MKVVINKSGSGLELSAKAVKKYLECKGKECFIYKWAKGTYLRVDTNMLPSFPIYTTKDLGFSPSARQIGGFALYLDRIERNDKDLIKVVEELGREADTDYSWLKIVEIPDDIEYEIDNKDGTEKIYEKSRVWD